MSSFSCDYVGCPGHEIEIQGNLMGIVVFDDVRWFANVDCILFFFAQFPSDLAIRDMDRYLQKHPQVLAKPNEKIQGEAIE